MRKLARQISFLLIYSSDMGKTDYHEVLSYYLDQDNLEDFLEAANIISVFPELDEETLESALAADDKRFIRETVAGTMANRDAIDEMINSQAKHWSTLRMMSADKNIMRLGVYELVFSDEKKEPAVIINEAVDLARIYGEAESYKFVNAILDTISKKAVANE
ncbi:MAG: transcription antitermination factor NusB [Peptococcaceae bacterium]|nr:transcription antitermination factor NusB [Peptococcaceae bacterium]